MNNSNQIQNQPSNEQVQIIVTNKDLLEMIKTVWNEIDSVRQANMWKYAKVSEKLETIKNDSEKQKKLEWNIDFIEMQLLTQEIETENKNLIIKSQRNSIEITKKLQEKWITDVNENVELEWNKELEESIVVTMKFILSAEKKLSEVLEKINIDEILK